MILLEFVSFFNNNGKDKKYFEIFYIMHKYIKISWKIKIEFYLKIIENFLKIIFKNIGKQNVPRAMPCIIHHMVFTLRGVTPFRTNHFQVVNMTRLSCKLTWFFQFSFGFLQMTLDCFLFPFLECFGKLFLWCIKDSCHQLKYNTAHGFAPYCSLANVKNMSGWSFEERIESHFHLRFELQLCLYNGAHKSGLAYRHLGYNRKRALLADICFVYVDSQYMFSNFFSFAFTFI